MTGDDARARAILTAALRHYADTLYQRGERAGRWALEQHPDLWAGLAPLTEAEVRDLLPLVPFWLPKGVQPDPRARQLIAEAAQAAEEIEADELGKPGRGDS